MNSVVLYPKNAKENSAYAHTTPQETCCIEQRLRSEEMLPTAAGTFKNSFVMSSCIPGSLFLCQGPC